MENKVADKIELSLGAHIEYKAIRETSIILSDDLPAYPAEFAIVKLNDVKPSFERGGTQGRVLKQDKKIADILLDFQPRKMFYQEGGVNGVPAIVCDGKVAVGNHRAEAIKTMLSKAEYASVAEVYRNEAKAFLGVDLAEDEMVVRMLCKGLVKDDILKISFASNIGRENTMGEKALSGLALYREGIKNLPPYIESSDVIEMSAYVAKVLDNNGGGLNLQDTNIALLASLAHNTRNIDIVASLDSVKGSAEYKAKIQKMYYDNAGSFHNIINNACLKSLDLRDYLAEAIAFTARADSNREADYSRLISEIEGYKELTIEGKRGALALDPYRLENLTAQTLGFALAKFSRQENPSTALYDALKDAPQALELQTQPTFFKEGKALSEVDIYDFLEYLIGQGLVTKSSSRLRELMSELRAMIKEAVELKENSSVEISNNKINTKENKMENVVVENEIKVKDNGVSEVVDVKKLAIEAVNKLKEIGFKIVKCPRKVKSSFKFLACGDYMYDIRIYENLIEIKSWDDAVVIWNKEYLAYIVECIKMAIEIKKFTGLKLHFKLSTQRGLLAYEHKKIKGKCFDIKVLHRNIKRYAKAIGIENNMCVINTESSVDNSMGETKKDGRGRKMSPERQKAFEVIEGLMNMGFTEARYPRNTKVKNSVMFLTHSSGINCDVVSGVVNPSIRVFGGRKYYYSTACNCLENTFDFVMEIIKRKQKRDNVQSANVEVEAKNETPTYMELDKAKGDMNKNYTEQKIAELEAEYNAKIEELKKELEERKNNLQFIQEYDGYLTNIIDRADRCELSNYEFAKDYIFNPDHQSEFLTKFENIEGVTRLSRYNDKGEFEFIIGAMLTKLTCAGFCLKDNQIYLKLKTKLINGEYEVITTPITDMLAVMKRIRDYEVGGEIWEDIRFNLAREWNAIFDARRALKEFNKKERRNKAKARLEAYKAKKELAQKQMVIWQAPEVEVENKVLEVETKQVYALEYNKPQKVENNLGNIKNFNMGFITGLQTEGYFSHLTAKYASFK